MQVIFFVYVLDERMPQDLFIKYYILRNKHVLSIYLIHPSLPRHQGPTLQWGLLASSYFIYFR